MDYLSLKLANIVSTQVHACTNYSTNLHARVVMWFLSCLESSFDDGSSLTNIVDSSGLHFKISCDLIDTTFSSTTKNNSMPIIVVSVC